jgi:hypothetical protein
MKFFRRVFSRTHPENVTKSIRCTVEMWNAIRTLAQEAGETPNAYIVLVLDQFLQVQLENGNLKLPTDADGKTAS